MIRKPEIKQTINWGFGQLDVDDQMVVPKEHAKTAQVRVHSYAANVAGGNKKFKTKKCDNGDLIITRVK